MHQSKCNWKYQAGQFVVAATDNQRREGCFVCVWTAETKYRILQTIRSPPPK